MVVCYFLNLPHATYVSHMYLLKTLNTYVCQLRLLYMRGSSEQLYDTLLSLILTLTRSLRELLPVYSTYPINPN